MLKRIVAGQIRHLLGGAGSAISVWLIENGASPTDVETIASGIVAIVMFAWSAYDKYKEEKKMEKLKDEKVTIITK